jgi:hypothetical protein
MNELYRVRLAFKPVEDYEFPTPIDVSADLHIERDGIDYLATIEVLADSAEESLEIAERLLGDFLACMAARAASYTIVHDARRYVSLVDPKPVTDGPIPPFQCVGGIITDAGAELLDPTGEQRRQRRIFSMFAQASVRVADISEQLKWFATRNPDLLTCGDVLPGQDNGPGHGRATIVARRFDFCRPPSRDDLGRLAGDASYGSHSFCAWVKRSGICGMNDSTALSHSYMPLSVPRRPMSVLS